MKFLCLAYGYEDGWNTLSEEEKRDVLAQDAVIRNRGNLMWAVQRTVTSVRDRNLEVKEEPFARNELPLAGFLGDRSSEREKKVIELVSNTP